MRTKGRADKVNRLNERLRGIAAPFRSVAQRLRGIARRRAQRRAEREQWIAGVSGTDRRLSLSRNLQAADDQRLASAAGTQTDPAPRLILDRITATILRATAPPAPDHGQGHAGTV